jgi:putative DNA primase/helicase
MNESLQHFATLRYLHSDAESVIPTDLLSLSQWITWQAGPKKKDGKFDKHPKGNDGTGFDWQKSSQWSSFATASAFAKRRGLSGVGVVLPAQFPDGSYLVVMDYDGVDLQNAENNPRLEEIRAAHEKFNSPYIERSPSGKGLRIFLRSSVLIPQISIFNPLGGKDELFCASGKWATVTGDYEGGEGIPDATEELLMMVSEWQAQLSTSKKSSTKGDATRIRTTSNRGGSSLSHLAYKKWTGWPAVKLKDNDGRELTMLAYAGHLRALGHTQDEIEKMCLDANVNHYEDRLDDDVVLDRARRYQKQDSSTNSSDKNPTSVNSVPAGYGNMPQDVPCQFDEPALDIEDRTDSGNVAVLARLTIGDLKYVPEQNRWIYWKQRRWNSDDDLTHSSKQALRVSEFYKGYAAKLRSDAESDALADEDKKRILNAASRIDSWATQCRNKNRLDAMRSLAQTDERFAVSANLLDVDPDLFGVNNGVVDLRTGFLREDAKSEFILKRSSVDFREDAPAPLWMKFLSEMTSRPGEIKNEKVEFIFRPQLVEALQRLLGYCLTGRTDAHKLFMFLGTGSNGKNVLLDIVQRILAFYGVSMPPEIILAAKYDKQVEQASPMMRMLQGLRLVVCSETKDKQELDTGVVKRITGGGYLTARGLHEKPVTFLMTHKIILMTNHRPGISQMDPAVRGRLYVFPFDMRWNRPGETDPDPTLPDADPKLMEKLWEERQGILQWLIEGAVKYHKFGLLVCPEVAAFTRDYIDSQDVLSRWIGSMERCEPVDGMLASELVSDYQSYCRSEDEPCEHMMSPEMGRRLKRRGFTGKRTSVGMRYGLRRKVSPVDAPVEVSADFGKKPLNVAELLAEAFAEE